MRLYLKESGALVGNYVHSSEVTGQESGRSPLYQVDYGIFTQEAQICDLSEMALCTFPLAIVIIFSILSTLMRPTELLRITQLS